MFKAVLVNSPPPEVEDFPIATAASDFTGISSNLDVAEVLKELYPATRFPRTVTRPTDD
jgi:hypothetical protein